MRRGLFFAAALLALLMGLRNGLDGYDLVRLLRTAGHAL